MNNLIQKVVLPTRFIYFYILHWIYEIKEINNRDAKLRLSKLLSFFLCNLLDHEHITFDAIPPSIDEIFKENCEEPDILLLKQKIEKYRKEQ